MAAVQPRYPIPFYSEGWFQVGWSEDLRPGQVKGLKHFGREYVLFRTASGQAVVLDDICPHLGAHFSQGGCVQGESVRCPYHGWKFGADGKCTEIAYAKSIPVKAKTTSHTVVERYGKIFMYRNKAGTAPTYELPQMENFDEASYTKPVKYEFKVRIHGQDIMENSVDSPHFWAVHRHEMPTNTFKSEGEELRITQETCGHFLGMRLPARLEFHMIEPGFHYVDFPVMPGPAAHVFSSIVPVDEEYVVHRMTIRIKKSKIPFLSRISRRFLIWQMMKTYREDMQIWETKEYREHPVLCDGDGAIMKLRRWYAQFHDPVEPESNEPPASERARRLNVIG